MTPLITYSSSSEDRDHVDRRVATHQNASKKTSGKENNKPGADRPPPGGASMSGLPTRPSSKPRPTPTKIVEQRPVAPLNKNLNSVKKQSPLANSSNRSSPEADRKRVKSDTSRLSRNVSKDIKTEEEEESSHSEASIGNEYFINHLQTGKICLHMIYS